MIVILDCSPRKKNCYNISNRFIKSFEENDIEYKYIKLYDLDIEHCTHCNYCEHRKGCCKKDDMNELYSLFDSMNGLVVVSPIHFDGLSSKLYSIIGRCQAIFNSKYVLHDSMIDRSKKRVSMPIFVGGSAPYENQMAHAKHQMDFFLKAINTKKICLYEVTNTDYEEALESYADSMVGHFTEGYKLTFEK